MNLTLKATIESIQCRVDFQLECAEKYKVQDGACPAVVQLFYEEAHVLSECINLIKVRLNMEGDAV